MTKAYERLQKCFQCVQEKIDFKPKVALILGSGLGDDAESIQVEAVLEYHDMWKYRRRQTVWLRFSRA